jgi:feruloyl esterase
VYSTDSSSGLTRETTLYNSELGKGLVNTICDTDNKNCKGDPFPISADWIRQLIIKDEDFDVGSITEESYLDILRASREEYFSQMDTSDPDLRPFQKKGGKIVSWHGLADTLIMPNGTSTYYDRVTAISPDVRDFYRFFEAPGVAHCAGGPGPAPLRALESLVRWVEENVAPEVLDAQSVPTSAGEPVVYRPLCPWPKVAAKRSDGPGQASSFACADSFDAALNAHDEL